VTTIRPTHLPAQTAAQPSTSNMSEAKSAAQRAFFQTALGGAAKPAAQAAQTSQVATAAAPAAPAIFAQPVQRIPDPKAEAPTRILRPGSLLDIRV